MWDFFDSLDKKYALNYATVLNFETVVLMGLFCKKSDSASGVEH